MVKKKESRRLGIMSKSETQFLYLTKEQKKKHVSDVMKRKHYQRITERANRAFQDITSMIEKLPAKQLEKIEFESGLNAIHRSLAKKGLTERTPLRAVEQAQTSLDSCLQSIRKYNKNLMKIAEPDFDIVRDWLNVIQKFPKPTGADI